MIRFSRGLFVAFLSLIGSSASAAVFKVNETRDAMDADPGDGICADELGGCTLRAAIQESNSRLGMDEINIPAGIFTLKSPGVDEDEAVTGDLDITDDLTISGVSVDETLIDGGAIDRLFDVHGETRNPLVSLRRMILRNGWLPGVWNDGGAAMRVGVGTRVMLDEVVMRNHRVSGNAYAVALYVRGCLEGRHVRVQDNRASHDEGFTTGVIGVGNPVTPGDAGSCLVLEDSEISGNMAGRAGAIFAQYAQVTLRRTLVSDNEGFSGSGAMTFNLDAPVLLENVTLSGNRGNPGAIMNDGFSRLDILNSTITNNGSGLTKAQIGGISDVHGGHGMTFLRNTILAGNQGSFADDCSKGNSLGGNIIGDIENCAQFDPHETDQLGVLPELLPLEDNGGFTRTHSIGKESIDRGQADACPALDQRGFVRPLDGDGDGKSTCDIGALELGNDVIYADGFEVQTRTASATRRAPRAL